MRRVNVIGNSCVGKSTFAARLAAVIGVRHVELDALFWQPDWIEAAAEVFRDRVAEATAGDGWVADGNYSPVRDIVWPRVDTLIWLDYPFPLVMWRALRRTAGRIVRGDECCNGNRETLGKSLSADSILLWVIRTHARRRREFLGLLPGMEARGTRVVVLRTPRAAERWLGEVGKRN